MKFTFDITNKELTGSKPGKPQNGNVNFAFFQFVGDIEPEKEEKEIPHQDLHVYLQVADNKKKKIYAMDRREFYTICKTFIKLEEI